MKKWKDYNIGFKGLKDGNHQFKYEIDGSFFSLFEGAMYEDGNLNVTIDMKKSSQMLIFDYIVKGNVASVCDVCLEPVKLPVDYSTRVYVKFGQEYEEMSEDIIIIPQEAHEINVAATIYDLIVTSLPIRHVHPTDENGNSTCNPVMIEQLSGYLVEEVNDDPDEETTDPRWDELKKLLDNNNK